MKFCYKLIVISFFVPFCIGHVTTNAEKLSSHYEEIQQQDITGDKIKETIKITGVFYNSKSIALKKPTLHVTYGGTTNTIKIPLLNGSKPVLSFNDFNRDGSKDVLVTIHPIGKDSTVKGYFYSFKDGQQINLSAPPPIMAETSFKNNYKASIDVGSKQFTIDVKSRKKTYDKLGLYQKGKLNEPIELIVSDYTILRPTYILQGNGVEGVQKVSGAFEADLLGEIRSTWVIEEGEWMLRKITFENLVKKP